LRLKLRHKDHEEHKAHVLLITKTKVLCGLCGLCAGAWPWPVSAALVERGDLRRRAKACFDRAVHVALVLDARVLAGEHHAAGGSRKPGAPRRIERRIEVRIPAARPWIVVPPAG